MTSTPFARALAAQFVAFNFTVRRRPASERGRLSRLARSAGAGPGFGSSSGALIAKHSGDRQCAGFSSVTCCVEGSTLSAPRRLSRQAFRSDAFPVPP